MKLKILRSVFIILVVLLLCNCGFDQNKFIKLIKNGTLNEIREAIDAGAKINAADEMGITPLMIATRYSEDFKIIKLLLEEGVDVNTTSNDTRTALMMAAEYNHSEEIIKLLLQYGADLTTTDEKGNTALILAVSFNQNPNVIRILAEQDNNIDYQNTNGETALIVACQNRSNLEIIQSLIDEGADLTIKDKHEETALIKTVKYFGTEKIIEYLIQNGANVTDKDSKKKNLAILAIENSASSEVLILLLLSGVSTTEKDVFGKNAMDYIKKGTPTGIEQSKIIVSCADTLKSLFLEEIRSGDVKTVKKHLDYGYNLNEKDRYQRTPLMIAAANNPNSAVIQLLIDEGARIDLTDNDKFGFEKGEAALSYAAKFNCNPEIIQVLIDNGALANEENDDGETPLMMAARSNPEVGIIQALIESGASLDKRDKEGKTPLMHAIANENPEITNVLIKAGANVNAQDPSGYTPLFFAITNKQTTRHIPILLKAGANVKHVDDTGFTAYDQGKFNEVVNQTEGFQLLTAYYFSDALYLSEAIRNGETDIISLILISGILTQEVLNQSFIQALSKDIPYELIWEYIQAGVDVNAQSTNYQKTYPLITAAKNTTNPRIIELLLESGAEPNKKDAYRHIALDYAKLNPNLKGTEGLQMLADVTPVYTANFLNYFNSHDVFEIKRCLQSNQLTQEELNKGFIKALSMDMSYDLIGLFILSGANTNGYNSDTYPLITAAKYTTDAHIIELLLNEGANPSKRDHSQLTALDYAMKNTAVRPTEIFKRLEERSPLTVDRFFECIASEDVEQIQIALSSGIPLNVKDSEGLSALMVAIKHTENKKIVELLVDKGADLSQRNTLGQTPLMMALIKNENIEIIRFLLNQTEDFTVADKQQRNLLMAAVQNPVIPLGIFQFFINKGIDVNARDKYGATLLHYVHHDVEKYRFLIDSGVDVNLRRKYISPLMRAVSNNFDIKIIELLIKHGAEIDSVDHEQNLLGGFLDIDTSDKTPLMVAVEYQINPEIIKLLIQSGADVNYLNPVTNQNSLINAVQNHSNPQIIHWLLEAGAQPNIRNSKGHSALFYAKENDYSKELLDELKQAIPYVIVIADNTNAFDTPGIGTKKIASFSRNKILEIVGRDLTQEWIKIYDSETNTFGWIPLYEEQLTVYRKGRDFAILNYTPGNMILYPSRANKTYTYNQFLLESGKMIDGVSITENFYEKNSDLLINNAIPQDVIVIISQDNQVEYSFYVKKHEKFYLNGIKAGSYKIGYWKCDHSNSSYWALRVKEIPSNSKGALLEMGMAQEYEIFSYYQ